MLKIPDAPKSIQKGVPLKHVLGQDAVECLAQNIETVHPDFQSLDFQSAVLEHLEPLGFIERGLHIAKFLRDFLPKKYEDAVKVLLSSLTPPNTETQGLGLAVLFYHPHGCFVAEYGLEKKYNAGEDPFPVSMKAQYELTKRNTSEFSIRPFLINETDRTLACLEQWCHDSDPHVRRLCSEGTRPRLPWASRLTAFVNDPSPVLPILETLKNDPVLYVRRSVANHLGDIAKDHPDLVFEICDRWLMDASKELKWVIRHALRHPSKKGNKIALKLRSSAK